MAHTRASTQKEIASGELIDPYFIIKANITIDLWRSRCCIAQVEHHAAAFRYNNLACSQLLKIYENLLHRYIELARYFRESAMYNN